MIAVVLVAVAAILFICGLVVVNRRENARDDRAYQPAYAPRPSGLHLPAGEGAGRQGTHPRPRLPARDPFAGDWPTLEQALHHELPVARDWPFTEDTPPEVPAPPPARAPGGGHVTLVTHHDTALWEGCPGEREPWEDATDYESAWRSRTGTLGIHDGQWHWLSEGQFGHADLTASKIMRVLSEKDLDTIAEHVRTRDGAA